MGKAFEEHLKLIGHQSPTMTGAEYRDWYSEDFLL